MSSLLTVSIAALAAAGQGEVANVPLYAGESLEASAITLSPWGGGSISDSTDVSYLGSHSLMVRTATYFQGGTVTFARPVSLAAYLPNRENLLVVAIYPTQTSTTATTGGGGTTGRGPGLAGGSGGAMGGGGATTTTQAAKPLDAIRLIIRTTDGRASEAYYPLPAGSAGRWRRLGVPLSAIYGFAKTNKEVASISFSGDAPSVFFIGEIRAVTDQTPIQGSLSVTELNLGRGQEITFYATAEAGPSILVYEWDYDAKDGIQVDYSGQFVTHRFRVAGEYTVTCTIRDLYGLKQPWQGTISVTVNP